MNTEQLILKRCYNHPSREAVALCPRCQRFFCRECVTEHESQMICALCLASLQARSQKPSREIFPVIGKAFLCVASFILTWLIFYSFGLGIAAIPSTPFHAQNLGNDSFFSDEDASLPESSP